MTVTFDDDDNSIYVITLGIDLDETCLDADETDIESSLAPTFVVAAQDAGAGAGYEIGVTINHQAYASAIPEGALFTLTVDVLDADGCAGSDASVGFVSSVLQFHDSNFTAVAGWTRDGSVSIPSE